jgi:ribosomal 50S subunit-recycling heat shock protein
MRIDKYLKVSRLIKRRTVAKDAADAGRVEINDRVVKAGAEVNVGDVICIHFGNSDLRVKVLEVKEVVKKEDAISMYEIL